MSGYTKLFSTIVNSTIWNEPDSVRLVWITMLATADKNGIVEASIPGLAHISRVSLKDCEKALEILLAPDPYSRTPEFDGRRIEKVDGGWFLLNHPKYRAKMSADERREYYRINKQQQRKKAKDVLECPQMSQDVSDMSTVSTHSEAEADSKAKAENTLSSLPLRDNPVPGFGGVINHRRKVCDWFGRRGSTAWQTNEEYALQKFVSAAAEDVSLLDWWFAQDNHFEKYGEGKRKGILAFLNNWVAEVDKARRAKEKSETKPISQQPF